MHNYPPRQRVSQKKANHLTLGFIEGIFFWGERHQTYFLMFFFKTEGFGAVFCALSDSSRRVHGVTIHIIDYYKLTKLHNLSV